MLLRKELEADPTLEDLVTEGLLEGEEMEVLENVPKGRWRHVYQWMSAILMHCDAVGIIKGGSFYSYIYNITLMDGMSWASYGPCGEAPQPSQ